MVIDNKKEQTWRFTFGGNHEKAGYCQPIIGTFASARAKMIEMYGAKWAFQYSEQEWEDMKNNPNRLWDMEKDLEVVRA